MIARILVLSILCWSITVCAEAQYPLHDPGQRAQFQALLHDLRCPVCQNQDLAESHAALASDLRDEVYHLVLAHKSDQEIMHYLQARYGDFILFRPPVTGVTLILWIGPVVLLIVGLGLFARNIRRQRDVYSR